MRSPARYATPKSSSPGTAAWLAQRCCGAYAPAATPTPVEAAPPRVFNAKTLIAQLEPIIKAEKCSLGNVCPHVHEYLLPKGTLR